MLSRLLRLASVLALSAGVYSQQTPLHLSAVSSDDYTVLANARFPAHRIRIRQSTFCDPTVK